MRMRSVLLLLLLPVLAQAQMYRWVDDNGKVHYSDRPPASGAKNVQKRASSGGQGSPAPLPYTLQQAVRTFPVTLYVFEACGEPCAQARELLSKRGVPYSEITVADEVDLAQLKKLSGSNALPVITVGREVHTGFESGAYTAALDNAGYPASSLLPPGMQARQPVTKPVRQATPAAGTTPAAGAGATPADGAGAGAEVRPATAPQETADTAAPK